ncbi:hypothetical protein T492DRAFT_554259, partial [Pavlovales sp. CCMP2436]
PPFLLKLFRIVDGAETEACVRWAEDGLSLHISDPPAFVRDVLPAYFKHNRLSSFLQQMRTYGFERRVGTTVRDGSHEFAHVHFAKGRPELLVEL